MFLIAYYEFILETMKKNTMKKISLNPMKLSLLIFVICLCTVKPASSQRFEVDNVSFFPIENNIVIVNYDLLSKNEKNRRYKVNLFVRQESNPDFSYRPGALLGDVGKGRFEGKDNTIIWSLDHEASKYDFKVDPFVNDYFFYVQARRKTGIGWWLLSAALAGGIYVFFIDPQF